MDPFITTFTGKKVNPLDLKIDDICVEDIAHHLSCINRFVGALKKPVSVAQHSVYVSRILQGTGMEAWGLFHDASEAYLGDVSKWVKQTPTMASYREAEIKAENVIFIALRIKRIEDDSLLKEADNLMVRYEASEMLSEPRHLLSLPSHPPVTKEEAARVRPWTPWPWYRAKVRFIEHARLLGYHVPPTLY